MSASKSSSKKPAAKPQVKVPKAAAPKEDPKSKKQAVPVKETKAKKPAIILPAPKATAKPVVKPAPKVVVKTPAKPVVEAKPKAVIAEKPATAKARKEAPATVVTETKASGKASEPKRRIDTPEIQEKIRELIKLAKEQDYLTYDDINEILPNDLVDPDDVEAIMERLRNMEFDIIDASEVDRYKDKKRDEGDGEEEDVKADQKLDILELPLPKPIRLAGRDLPPSHANFLIVNGGVLVPLYGQDSDKVALGVVGDCFPGRKIVGIDCRAQLPDAYSQSREGSI